MKLGWMGERSVPITLASGNSAAKSLRMSVTRVDFRNYGLPTSPISPCQFPHPARSKNSCQPSAADPGHLGECAFTFTFSFSSGAL